MNIVGSGWVFKIKIKSDGSVDRLKTCLVAKGYNQKEGVDFNEIFSSVIKHATIRIILSLALVSLYLIYQFDLT